MYYMLCVICALCAIAGFLLASSPKSPQGALRLQGVWEAGSLELDCGGREGRLLFSCLANTRHPRGCGLIPTLEEAQLMLHFSKLLRSLALQLLAKVVSSNLCLGIVEEEEHMLLLILNGVEGGCTLVVGLICKGDTLGEVGDGAIVSSDFGDIVTAIERRKSFACHKALSSLAKPQRLYQSP